jgi:hypothetical protein
MCEASSIPLVTGLLDMDAKEARMIRSASSSRAANFPKSSIATILRMREGR